MPLRIKYPGVYVEEIPRGPQTIAAASTSVTGFIGSARKGGFGKAFLVRSFSEFEAGFGGLQQKAELGYAVRQFFINGGEAWIARIARNAPLAKIQSALRAFDSVEQINLLALPGVADTRILTAAADYCRKRRAFLIVDSPRDALTPAQILQAISSVPKTRDASLYFPWVNILDPLTGTQRLTPPSGTIAAMYARMDSTRGVWKSPAGKEAILKGVEALAYNLTEAENALLNPRAINALRAVPGSGIVAWGARTLEGDDALSSEWKYISVRRLALFIEQSIERGTQWTVFEPNDEPLWLRVRSAVETFLAALWRQGALMGQTPRDAFYVRCDRTTMTQNDIASGRVNIEIGFAPLKPAEFVIVRIQQPSGLP